MTSGGEPGPVPASTDDRAASSRSTRTGRWSSFGLAAPAPVAASEDSDPLLASISAVDTGAGAGAGEDEEEGEDADADSMAAR